MNDNILYLEMEDNSQIMHEVRHSVELILAINVVTGRIFPDYLPKFLLLYHGPDFMLSFVRILKVKYHIHSFDKSR